MSMRVNGYSIARACALLATAATLAWAEESGLRGVKLNRPPPGTEAGGLQYHALVIGINDYRDFPSQSGWDDLRAARPDAEAVARVLQESYGFDVRTLFDGEATRDAIVSALDELANLGESDAVLVYYAGHGHLDERLNEGFWIPSDARRSDGARSPTEDWVWNSTITKILGATKARHVLVLSDSCYSGSLFRGGDPAGGERDLTWYRRAVSQPSRFLITSGDLEPVQDGDGPHSVFAQQVLNVLQHPDQPVFSASDLGLSVRQRVSTLTGQLVRMGPMAVATHAGGEMVFRRQEGPAVELLAEAGGGASATALRGAPAAAAPAERRRDIQDAVLLHQQGATQAAQALLSNLTAGTSSNDRLVEAVSGYLSQNTRTEQHNRLRSLMDRLETRAAAQSAATSTAVRPRVLACLGPAPLGESADGLAIATLYRIALSSEFMSRGGVNLVEREAFEEVLKEMELGSSALSDQNAKLTVGKLLPASFLLIGNLFTNAAGERVFLRVVDTESSRLVATLSAATPTGQDPTVACSDLAAQVLAALTRARPLEAPAAVLDGDKLSAGLGSFHGAQPGMVFDVLAAGQPVGRATVIRAGEMDCDLQMTGTLASASADLRLREAR